MAQGIIGPKFYGYDENNVPLAFGKLYTYEAGTTTPKATYTAEGQAVANTNPVILNGEGYADVYLDGSYNMVLTDVNDVEQWSSDPVSSQLEIDDLPQATELQKGVAQIVTSAEMALKTDDSKIATAKKVWEILGAAAELNVGTSDGELVLKENINGLVPTGTELVLGKLLLATVAEAETGTDTEKAITAAGLKAAIDTSVAGDILDIKEVFVGPGSSINIEVPETGDYYVEFNNYFSCSNGELGISITHNFGADTFVKSERSYSTAATRNFNFTTSTIMSLTVGANAVYLTFSNDGSGTASFIDSFVKLIKI